MTGILDELRKAQYITTLDLSQAYFQIELDETSREITTFVVPGSGLFQFKSMPYGLTNAPAIFQRLLDKIVGISLHPSVYVYLDDIIIISRTFDEYLSMLEEVLRRLKDAQLVINREKSEFCCSQVKYLGFLVNSAGLQIDPEKVEAVLQYPVPQNLKQLRRFLGMASWYRRFIPGFATVAEPLTRLMKKSQAWEWMEEQARALDTLKRHLTSSPTSACPDFSQPFTLQTDVSSVPIGAVLTHEIDGEERVIAYASRALTETDKCYTVTEQECLAEIWAIEKFHCYLEVIVVDHSSLRWLHNLRNPTGRLARWALSLLEYDYQIIHIKGALHHVLDALSRAPEGLIAPDEGTIQRMQETTDKWYTRRFRDVQHAPDRFPDWKIEGELLYTHRQRAVRCDLFTKWIEVFPLRSTTGRRIREVIERDVINRWGTLCLFYSDNGLEFVNKDIKALAKEIGMTLQNTPPYHPQGNPVERVNRVLKMMLRAFTDDDHREWDRHLHEFCFAYNTAVHSSLKASSAFANFGREPTISASLRRELEGEVTPIPCDPQEWVERMKRLETLRKVIKHALRKAQDRQAHYYNLRHRSSEFEIGELVLRRTHTLSNAAKRCSAALAKPFDGPYVIDKKLSSTRYELGDKKLHREAPKETKKKRGVKDKRKDTGVVGVKTQPVLLEDPRQIPEHPPSQLLEDDPEPQIVMVVQGDATEKLALLDTDETQGSTHKIIPDPLEIMETDASIPGHLDNLEMSSGEQDKPSPLMIPAITPVAPETRKGDESSSQGRNQILEKESGKVPADEQPSSPMEIQEEDKGIATGEQVTPSPVSAPSIVPGKRSEASSLDNPNHEQAGEKDLTSGEQTSSSS
ncbi:uncharacterized protein LOC107042140 [Diachasma alloeum]|uniref:uncharacterized protein LOC107042140 n=1 Tax=Diachasma alloeum TaxID=454923 RepID=UPI0007381622|nr:uncharacterized protein LOC107042140 [Diachasma alloeum]